MDDHHFGFNLVFLEKNTASDSRLSFLSLTTHQKNSNLV
jgi:hypothetical protein